MIIFTSLGGEACCIGKLRLWDPHKPDSILVLSHSLGRTLISNGWGAALISRYCSALAPRQGALTHTLFSISSIFLLHTFTLTVSPGSLATNGSQLDPSGFSRGFWRSTPGSIGARVTSQCKFGKGRRRAGCSHGGVTDGRVGRRGVSRFYSQTRATSNAAAEMEHAAQ